MDEKNKDIQSDIEETTETVQPVEEPQTDQPEVGKTFTQDEVNGIVKTRLEKEREKTFKKLGITDEKEIETLLERAKKLDELTPQVETLQKENETLKQASARYAREKTLNDVGVDPQFIEYVDNTVDKGTSAEEYKTNVEAFLKANPKMLKENYQTINSSLDLSGKSKPDLEKMTTEQYMQWRKDNPL